LKQAGDRDVHHTLAAGVRRLGGLAGGDQEARDATEEGKEEGK